VRVIIGYDASESEAARVAAKTLMEVTHGELKPEFLYAPKLRAQGLLTRPEDTRGQRYDFVSNAPCATEFSNSRFLTPILVDSGLALFVDSDVVFMRDPREMVPEQLPQSAVSVVKHGYAPTGESKMCGQAQTRYGRKNWSSVMLFNCDHPANRRLSLWDVNNRPGRDLHQFYWLDDDEVGALLPAWNWLVGEQPRPTGLGIAHFTLGGPFTSGWPGAAHDSIWLKAAGLFQQG
jgi:hypothetical protein